MSSSTLLADIAIAIAVAAIVLIISPGLAVIAILAILVLLVCGISFVYQARRAGSRKARPPRRTSRGR